MWKHLSPLWYTVYSVVSTILEETALALIVLLVLPMFNIHIPPWGLATMMVALAGYGCFSYIMGRRALRRKPTVSPESIIGHEGQVIRPLSPEGLVKVEGELWQARCTDAEMQAGDEVVVVGIDKLKLMVSAKAKRKI